MDPLALLGSLLRKTPAGESVILELDLDFSILSAPPGNPLEALRAINSPTMRALREGLREASTDSDVLGLIVHLGTCPLTATQTSELGQALESFGAAKPVWAYTESFAEIGTALLPYVLATSASQIWLQESGQVGLGGVRAGITLLRGSFDKVGLEPEFSKRQEYKSAADSYSAHEISDANREMIQRIADSITATSVETIARRRTLTTEQVWAAVDAGILRPAEAVERGLVDQIGYRDEVYAAARQEWQRDVHPARLRYLHRYAASGHAFEVVT
ncbi:MAG: S49 family peptidase, partial [Micropruina sp.]